MNMRQISAKKQELITRVTTPGYQTTAREAEAEGKPFSHHLAHLAVHGFLHLLGYDHETDRDAEEMEDLERRILRRLAVPDPYAPRLTQN